MKSEAPKVMEMVQFLKSGDNTVDLHVWTKVLARRKKGDEQILYGRLHVCASSSLVSYHRLVY